MSEWASSKTENLFLWRINQCLNTESTLQKRPLPFPTQKISFWFFQVGLRSAPNINGVLNRHLIILATGQAGDQKRKRTRKSSWSELRRLPPLWEPAWTLTSSLIPLSPDHTYTALTQDTVYSFLCIHQTLLTKLKEKNTSYTPLYSQYPKYFFVELKQTTDTHQLLFYI